MKYIKELDKIQQYHMLACIAARIDSLDQSDSRETLSPKSVIEHVAADVGRDCKLLMRYGVFIFRDIILTEGHLNTMGKFLCASAKITRHAYCTKIRNLGDYNQHFCRLLDEWCLAYNLHDPSALARKHKPHTLYHIPECVSRFGPLRLYATEIFERENGDMRQRISKTNHGKVTRDLLNVYVKEKTAKTLNEGTYVLMSLPGNTYATRQLSTMNLQQYDVQSRRGICFSKTGSVNINTLVTNAYAIYFHEHDNHQLNNPTSYSFLRLLNTEKTAKCNRSWMIYTTESGDRVGFLKALLANKSDGGNGVACFQPAEIQTENDVFGNKVIRHSDNLECVPITSIKRICSVQKHCASCSLTETSKIRGDLDNKLIRFYDVRHTCDMLVLNIF
jgi:hypothetical protein